MIKRYVIRNTNTNTSWYLPEDFKLHRGMYFNMKWVEKNLPRLLVDSIHNDMDSAAPTHMSDIPTDNGTVFQIMMHSRYTKNAIQLHYDTTESIPVSIPASLPVPVSAPDVKPLDDTESIPESVPVSVPESDERHSAESILGKMLGWFGSGNEPLSGSEPLLGEPLSGSEPLLGEPLCGSEPLLGEPLSGSEPLLGEPLCGNEPLSEPLSEPLCEPLSEPLSEPLCEPLCEPLSEPLCEPLLSEPLLGEPLYIRVQNLKSQAVTQMEVAFELGISRSTVKRNWKTR